MLNKIKNLSRSIAYLYKTKKENIILRSQEKIAGEIFDLILQKTPIDAIYEQIQQPVSSEIKSILNALKKIGYLTNIKPLPQKPSTSVIIPHYNQSIFLDEALFYLSKQTTLPDEVIIVDDQSKDIEQVEKLHKKYCSSLNIKLLKPQHKLYSGKCRQYGAEAASSNIIIMHDADDISHVNRIKLTKKFFQKQPLALHMNVGHSRFRNSYFNFFSKFENIDLNKFIITPDKIGTRMKKMFVKQNFSSLNQYNIRTGCYGTEGDYFWGSTSGHVAYNRKLVSLIQWTSPKNYVFTKHEDYDFNFLLFLAGQNSYEINLPLVAYRIGSSTHIFDPI